MYLYTTIKSELNGLIHKQITSLADARVTINRAAREVWGDVDLNSAKRRASSPPNLFTDIYDYSCPADCDTALIDVSPQVNRSKDSEVSLINLEEFDRVKGSWNEIFVAFQQDSGTRKLKVSMPIDDDTLIISELDTLSSGGGTWALFGDGTNLTVDNDNYVRGNGSINWDISAAGGTTAGIQNATLDLFDIDEFTAAGAVFVWVYITSATDITNFILRLGQDSSNYYSKTITTTNEGTAFTAGWNLLRFDLQSLSSTGSPAQTDLAYAVLYMTKAVGKISETDYRFDWLVLKRGKIYNIWYYSTYPWQTSASVWIADSTADTDYLNAGADEYKVFLEKCVELALRELKQKEEADRYEKSYEGKKNNYKMTHISEAKVVTGTYYNL